MAPPPYDAIVLTGGTGTRLAGAYKPALLVGGRSLVERAAAAVGDATRLVVVGPDPGAGPGPATLHPTTVVTREDPPGTGPVAALAAGVAYVTADHVAVLAADLPFLTPAAVAALRTALAATPGAAAAVPVDAAGLDQPLCSVWRSAALRAALAALGDPAGASFRRLMAATEHAGTVLRLPDLASDGRPPPWFDCDTVDDLAQAERWEQDHRS